LFVSFLFFFLPRLLSTGVSRRPPPLNPYYPFHAHLTSRYAQSAQHIQHANPILCHAAAHQQLGDSALGLRRQNSRQRQNLKIKRKRKETKMFQTFSARHRYPQLLQLIILLFLILVLNSFNKKSTSSLLPSPTCGIIPDQSRQLQRETHTQTLLLLYKQRRRESSTESLLCT
jgi:hypothetical protein